jgi:thioredoxin 1
MNMKMIKQAVVFTALLLALAPFAAAKEKAPAVPKTADGIEATFIELGSVNCIPCKAMQPVMAAIEKEYAGRVKVIFYDVWTNAGAPYGRQYKIKAIPTQVFLDKEGKEFFRHLGFFSKEEIEKVLEKQGIKQTKPSVKAPDKPFLNETIALTDKECNGCCSKYLTGYR